ncbi:MULTISPECIES: entericidin A/B family lipoprotein [unclassified Acidiphilium]|uniref:entericidin A/B family lipoprotein n=2 Tax=Acidocellaceae TaxID=3385905 RepID=UPI0009D72570|nr:MULTISPECIES: entericidin A/B family lipoprotein [unclassified Acidiphilium]OYV54299.1 MAG: hypothetical protein B7Z76_15005 [Acidiphilium sp. 20-67-58]OYV87922.1 MAG: hypothetical protein B7Z64_00335 [Acidiphilium sp. 21-68-69]
MAKRPWDNRSTPSSRPRPPRSACRVAPDLNCDEPTQRSTIFFGTEAETIGATSACPLIRCRLKTRPTSKFLFVRLGAYHPPTIADTLVRSGRALRQTVVSGNRPITHRDPLVILRRKTERMITMQKSFTIALALLVLIAVAPLLDGCHTTAGVGRDISSGGNALTNSAVKHTP